MGRMRRLMRMGVLDALLEYLLNDEFTTDDAAPLSSPRTAEPGPGTGTITDTGNKLSISGGQVVVSGGSGSWGNPAIVYEQSIFPAGRVFAIDMRQRSTLNYNFRAGWKTGAQLFADASNVATSQTTWSGFAINQNTWYQVRLLSDIEYAYIFSRLASGGNWILQSISFKNEQANLFPAVTNNDWIGDFDNLSVYDTALGEFGTYSVRDADGLAISATADTWLTLKWTPQSAEILDFQLRRASANDCLIVRCNQTAGTIQLIEVVAGVENVIDSDTVTWTANDTFLLRGYLSGTTIKVVIFTSTNSLGEKLNATSSVQQSTADYATTGGAWVRDLLAFPLTYADPFLSPITARATINVLAYGDSKTAGTGTSSYVQFLCRAIGGAEIPARIARGGYSTTQMKALIDADLAAASGTPDYVCYNLGANDVTSLVEATWKSETAYILDAMHAKWPNARIYCMRPWRRTYDTQCDTMATWLADVLSTRTGWAFAGPDERVFLEGGDDGVRYTADGTHPRTQEGYILTARQWQTAMGL